MEEFRPFLADQLALSLVNLRQVQGKDFQKTESGAVTMSDEARKELFVTYQKRKQEEIQHPFLGETVAVGLLPYVQPCPAVSNLPWSFRTLTWRVGANTIYAFYF